MNTRNTTLCASLFIFILTLLTSNINAQCGPGEDTTPPTINACAFTRAFIGCDVTAISGPAFSAITATSSEAEFEDANNLGDVTDNCTIASVTYVDIATGTCPITVTRTWTISDQEGNPSACDQIITVTDNVAPVITTGASAGTSECQGADPDANTDYIAWLVTNGGATATDDCSAVTWSNSAIIASWTGACPQTITIIFAAIDDCGNFSTTSADFTITDVSSPAFALPALPGIAECEGFNPDVNTGYTIWLANNGGAIAIDICSGVTWSNDSGTATWTGTCPQTITIIFTANDDCGNQSTTSADFTITDLTAPDIATPAVTGNAECQGLDPNINTGYTAWLATNGGASASEICGGGLTWSNNSGTAMWTGICTQNIIIDFTATDGCGNASTTSADFNIADLTGPDITTPAGSASAECVGTDPSINPDYLLWLVGNGGANASDLCGIGVTWSNNSAVATWSGICPQTITIVFTASDDCGNQNTTSADFTITDLTSPIIGLPATPGIAECEGPDPDVNSGYTDWLANNGGAIATDLCSGVTWSNDSGTATWTGTCTQTITIVFTASDDCGNANTTSSDFTITDNLPPVVTTPAESLDATVECSDAVSLAFALSFFPTATDNCTGTPTMVPVSDITTPDGVCPNAYLRVRVWNFTDGCGNTSANFTQTITVIDNTAPLVTTPAESLDANLECSDASGIATALASVPSATDNCTAIPTLQVFSDVTTPDGLCPNAYVRVRVWNFTDGCGNTSLSYTQTISVHDDIEPVVITPAESLDVTLECSDALALASALSFFPTATDNCTIIPIIQLVTDVTTPIGTCPYTYVRVRTWNFMDDCGNTSSNYLQFITVVDNIAPVLSGEGLAETINCPALPVFIAPTAVDACDGAPVITFSDVSVAGACAGAYATTRTWRATDACGNTSLSVSQTITVQDVTAPVVLTPAGSLNATVECSDPVGLAAALAAFPTATDGCDATPTLELVGNNSELGLCPAAYVLIRIWNFTDDCGNTSANFSQTITVQDITAPVLSGQGLATTINCPALPVFTAPTAVDACDVAPVITFSDVSVAGACAGAYATTRTWLATDACGNTSLSVSQTITVQDVTAPVVLTPAGSLNATVECSDPVGLAAALAAFPTATDACDATPTLELVGNNSELGLCPAAYVLIRIWNFTDDCGNTSANFSQTITVRDITAPVLSGQGLATTINCPALPVFIAPTAVDACDGAPVITFSDVSVAGACAGAYATTRTWLATDACGNTSLSVSQTITVQDVTAPVLSGQGLATAINCPALPVFTAPTAVDACDVAPVITFSDVSVAGACAGAYATTRTWLATDACGNTSLSVSQTITVQDVTAPVVLTPAGSLNATVECSDPVGLAAALAAFPTATDACDATPTLELVGNNSELGLCPAAYVLIRIWNFTDDCGNTSANFSQTITVRDITAPVLSGQGLATTINCPALPVFTAPTAVDACDGAPVITFSDVSVAGACAGAYATTRTWLATDACGNTSLSVSQTITVQDVTAPVVLTPAGSLNATVECSDPVGLAAALAAFPTATDACDATPTLELVGNNSELGLCPAAYVLIRIWNFTDDCGNTSANFSQTITVRDITAPVLSGQGLATTINCPALPVFTAPTAVDACDVAPVITFSDVSVAGACAGAYATTRTWRATDACGNTSLSVSQTITVQDVTAPVLSGQGLATTINCPALPVFIAPTAVDACDGAPVITFSDVSVAGACAGAYATTRTWRATDACGNTSLSVSQTITVQDVTAPVVLTPAGSLNATVECSDPVGLAAALAAFPTATDACDATPTLELVGNNSELGLCPAAYVLIRIWNFTDDCGNTSANFSQTITVRDITAPVLSGQGLAATINCPALPVFTAPTAVDACDVAPVITFSDVSVAGACAGAYATTRTWLATDACGNTSLSVSQTITVQDVTAPVVLTPAGSLNATVECSDPVGLAAALAAFPTATDACDATPTLELVGNNSELGLCPAAYVLIRIWNFTDDCGNTSSNFTQTITVIDNIAPVVTTPTGSLDATVECSNATALATALAAIPSATDNCTATPTLQVFSDVTTPDGLCPNAYVRVRVWNFTDGCGNTSGNFTQTITVFDITPPIVLNTPGDFDGTVECSDEESLTFILSLIPSATDNCTGTPTMVLVSDITTPDGICPNAYVRVRVWNFTDGCGNTSTDFTQTITVQDNMAPVISGALPELSIEGCFEYDAPPAAVTVAELESLGLIIDDACTLDEALVVSYSDVSSGFCPIVLIRTYVVTDVCLNSSTAIQTIYINDTTAPLITGTIPDATVEGCVAGEATPAATSVGELEGLGLTIYDACYVFPTLNLSGTGNAVSYPSLDVTSTEVSTGTCPIVVTRTYVVTDACLNSATAIQIINVSDTTAPVLSGEGVAETIDCPALPAFSAPTAVDACDVFPLITFSDATIPGSCAGTYATTRTWVATDACGNTSLPVSQTITVQDVTAPVLSGEGLSVTIDCPAMPAFDAPTAVDACDIFPLITFTDVTIEGICAGTFATTRTWVATDACGNTSLPVSQTITVQDVTAPVLSGEGLSVTIDCPALPAFGAPTAVDGCDVFPLITFTDVTVPGACAGAYATTRTWVATDACGNTSLPVSQTITVQDVTAPVLSGEGLSVTIDCPALPAFDAPTAVDGCDVFPLITFTDVTIEGICAGTFATTRTWVATDACGNTSLPVSQTITVQDVTAPVLSGEGLSVTIDCPALPVFDAPTAVDGCDVFPLITFADVTVPGACAGAYATTRTWVATDACGNTSLAVSQTINVQDVIAPVLSGEGLSVTIDCPALPVFDAPTAVDGCDVFPLITFADVTVPGACAGAYATTRTWVATDACGNTSLPVSQTITTQDITAPVITCPIVESPIECGIAPFFGDATAMDLCDNAVDITFATVTIPGSCGLEYSQIRTWTAIDDCGNSSTCSATIVVIHTAPPLISCQVDVSPIECGTAPVFISPIAVDVCDGTLDITFSDVTVQGLCPQEYSVTRSWTATDDCGNASTCTSTIVVEDNTAPVLSGQGLSVTIDCPAIPVFTAPIAVDVCDGEPLVTFTDVTVAGACAGAYATTRTWVATDACGNTSLPVSQTITTQDITAPVITCPIVESPIECGIAPFFGEATAIDLCDNAVDITFTTVTIPGSCGLEYSQIRTWTAIDDCGNSSTCSATIVVIHTAPPLISCQVDVSPIECGTTPVFISPIAVDVCDGTLDITFSDVTVQGLCPQEYTVTRSWTATDDCGNASTCTSTIVVEDNTAPVLSGQGLAVTINCPALPVFTAPTAVDACNATPVITFTDVTVAGACAGAYATTRTWVATDACGNTSLPVSQTITTQDITAPVITCPIVESPIECGIAPFFGDATAMDLCDNAVDITFTTVTIPGSCGLEYSQIRTWTAIDDCGNSSTCSATIVVIHTAPPLISCQVDVSPIGCGTTPVFISPIAVDVCDGTLDITFSDVTVQGLCPQEYSVTRSWTATDDCGNASTCTSTIVVEDNTAPVLSGQGLSVTIDCPAIPVFTAPISVDICDGEPLVTFIDVTVPGACAGAYATTRTWLATDGCGNTSLPVSQTITTQDIAAPVITCPIVESPIECGIAPFFGDATAMDLCDNAVDITFTTVTIPGSCGLEYSQIRTWTAIDDCGNSSTCSATIVVIHTAPPLISCQVDVSPIECGTTPVFISPIAVDVCDGTLDITFSDVTVQGLCPQEYSVTRSWTATDDCGNASTCTSTIVVEDNTAPVLSGQGLSVTIDCPALPVFTAPIAIDACDGEPLVTFTDVTVAGACAGAYATTRTWHATDACGNTSLAVSQTITVQDITAPVLSGQGIAVTINCPALPVFTSPTAVDACSVTPVITFTDVTIAGACAGAYTLTRTWVATDACGNTSFAVSQTITVQDVTAPVLLGQGLAATINCPTLPVFTAPTAVDACSAAPVITFTDVTVAGACAGAYTVTRTWVATDACGNTSLAVSQTITVQDVTAPVLSGQGIAVTINCPALPVFTAPTAVDACSAAPVITFTDVTVAGACAGAYTTTRTWVATDACGNTSLPVSQSIAVQDVTAPVLSGQGIAVTINCPALPVFTAPTAVDACSAAPVITFTDVTVAGACAGAYITTRTWIATDACGNTSLAVSQTITVQDVTAPVLSGQGIAVTINCPALPVFTAPTAIDACSATPVITFTDVTVAGACAGAYTVTRTWIATDACGNTSLAVSQTITVQDVTAPLLSGQGIAVTIDCPALPVFTAPTAVDACSANPVITFTDVTVAGACAGTYTVTRTWVATDACGNTSLAVSQTITVQDVTAPVLSGQGIAVTINCPALPVFTAPTAVDACSATPVITFTDVTGAGACAGAYTVTRTWVATDACGNTSFAVSQTITVQDVTAPVLSGQGIAVTINCPALPLFTAPTAVDACSATPVITFTDVTVAGACAGAYTVTRTWVATDACGNTSLAVSQTITSQDINAPVIIGLLTPATIEGCVSANVPPAATTVAALEALGISINDACTSDAGLLVTSSDASTGTCPIIVTRTYVVSDACLNSATTIQVINVDDNTAPVVTGAIATITTQGCGAANGTPAVTTVAALEALGLMISDACTSDAALVVTSTDVITGTCLVTLTRTYVVTDICLNSTTATQVFIVNDVTGPTITLTDPLLAGVPNGGTIDVQCYGQDPNWNPLVFNASDASATDDCNGIVTITFAQVLISEGNCAVDGYITLNQLTWTAADACGNSSSAYVFMAVIDTIPPVLHGVPVNITVNCDALPPIATNILATDECLCACDILFSETTPVAGCQNGQVIVRTWTATDRCGNITTGTQRITLIDNASPVIIMLQNELVGFPDGTVIDYTCNEGGIPLFYKFLNASSVSSLESCGGPVTISYSVKRNVVNNCEFFGYIEQRIFIWQAVDLCGNTTTLTITVHLIDNEAPVITGVPEITCIDDPLLDNIEAIDNCGNGHLAYRDVKIPNPCGVGIAIRRTYEAYDDCGNISRDTVILMPNDHTKPTLEFVNPLLLNLELGEVLIMNCAAHDLQNTPFGTQDVSFEDSCRFGVKLTYSEKFLETGNCAEGGNVGLMQLLWTATDACGNFSTLTVIASIEDNIPPEFVNFKSDVHIGCNDSLPDYTVTDNCGRVTITTDDRYFTGDCVYEYYIERLITATDPCGNATTRFQTIHVGNSNGPVINGVVPEICDDLTIPNVTAFDECAGVFVKVIMTEDTLSNTCEDGFVIQRTWTAVDACGHTQQIVQNIVINDKTPPEIQIPTYSIIRKFIDQYNVYIYLSYTEVMELLDALDDNSVYVDDACDVQIVPVFTVDTIFAENCIADGYSEIRTYTWVATDICGNSSSITFSIHIVDDMAPVFEGIANDTTITCAPLLPVPVVVVIDPSQPTTLVYSQSVVNGILPNEFIVNRLWIATDGCGNSAQATQQITWIPNSLVGCDIILPSPIECNSNGNLFSANVTGGLGQISYQWEVTGSDWFIQGGQGTDLIKMYAGFGPALLTLTVTDAFGCTSVCTASLNCVHPLTTTLSGIISSLNPDEDNAGAPNLTDALLTAPTDYLQAVRLWPNPAEGTINLSFESIVESDVTYSFINYLGQEIYTDQMNAAKGFNAKRIDITRIPEGTYLVRVKTEKELHTKIVVIMRND